MTPIYSVFFKKLQLVHPVQFQHFVWEKSLNIAELLFWKEKLSKESKREQNGILNLKCFILGSPPLLPKYYFPTISLLVSKFKNVSDSDVCLLS